MEAVILEIMGEDTLMTPSNQYMIDKLKCKTTKDDLKHIAKQDAKMIPQMFWIFVIGGAITSWLAKPEDLQELWEAIGWMAVVTFCAYISLRAILLKTVLPARKEIRDHLKRVDEYQKNETPHERKCREEVEQFWINDWKKKKYSLSYIPPSIRRKINGP